MCPVCARLLLPVTCCPFGFNPGPARLFGCNSSSAVKMMRFVEDEQVPIVPTSTKQPAASGATARCDTTNSGGGLEDEASFASCTYCLLAVFGGGDRRRRRRHTRSLWKMVFVWSQFPWGEKGENTSRTRLGPRGAFAS